jgi:RimJ/RimL family protein N-acetyltransferase
MTRIPRRLTAAGLQSRRLSMEPLQVEHATEAVAVFNDQRLHTYLGTVPETVNELRGRFARQVLGHSADGSEDWLNWMIRDQESGEIVGTVQSTVYHSGELHDGTHLVAEVAWVVATPFQRRGVAVEAAGAMTEWLRSCGVDVVIAHIHPENLASIGVARRLGLHPTEIVFHGEVRWRSR